MRVAMIMHDEDTLNGTPHPKIFIVVLEALEARGYRWVLFWLSFFRAVRGPNCSVRSLCTMEYVRKEMVMCYT